MTSAIKIIEKKQTGKALSEAEISLFIEGYVSGRIPDYQMSALLMAIFFRGMNLDETVHLTQAMLDSGERVEFTDLPVKPVDKHSTGGVGDKMSLLVAPITAACGGLVPMISGRALGHTGGTLDKLESIPGFKVHLSAGTLKQYTLKVGAAFAGQNANIVPADRKIYALRDVTATVKSPPLIAASIISKKAAEGIKGLVLDVKTGTGAFFENRKEAERLGKLLVEVGNGFGIKTVALLTDMSQPLGMAVGNWLEVRECIDIMRTGKGAADIMELNRALSFTMLKLSGLVKDYKAGCDKIEGVLSDKSAYRKFSEIVNNQGGDIKVIENPDNYAAAKSSRQIKARQSGYINIIDARGCGEIVMGLGAGRQKIEDEIDHQAGAVLLKKRGDYVEKGEVLAVLYADAKEKIESASRNFSSIYKIGKYPPEESEIILGIITSGGFSSFKNFIESV